MSALTARHCPLRGTPARGRRPRRRSNCFSTRPKPFDWPSAVIVPSGPGGATLRCGRFAHFAAMAAIRALQQPKDGARGAPRSGHSALTGRITWALTEDLSTGDPRRGHGGLDHVEAFADPQQGSSLWSAAGRRPSTPAWARRWCAIWLRHFHAWARLDVSVMRDNAQAIALYENSASSASRGVRRQAGNAINEPFYTSR